MSTTYEKLIKNRDQRFKQLFEPRRDEITKEINLQLDREEQTALNRELFSEMEKLAPEAVDAAMKLNTHSALGRDLEYYVLSSNDDLSRSNICLADDGKIYWEKNGSLRPIWKDRIHWINSDILHFERALTELQRLM